MSRWRLGWTLRESQRSAPLTCMCGLERAPHARGANSFRPFRLTPPKGKVSGSEETRRKERVCEEPAFE